MHEYTPDIYAPIPGTKHLRIRQNGLSSFSAFMLAVAPMTPACKIWREAGRLTGCFCKEDCWLQSKMLEDQS